MKLLLLLSVSGLWLVNLEPDSWNQSGEISNSELAGLRSFDLSVTEGQSRIIGGVVTLPYSWPWQVSLRLLAMSACGGAIVSPLWVISAAHCFKRYNKASYWTVMAGKHDLDIPIESGQQVVAVSRIITHKHYSIRTKESDLALLKLKQPLVFSAFVRPINIWMPKLPLLTECTITGWGSTRENGPRVNLLQEVNVTIIPSEVCNNYYVGRIRDTMFCAGKEEGGVDACQGDSGGPLSCFNGTRYELAGVVSWGVGCGRARKPGVYTKMQYFVPWITDVIMNEEILLDNANEEEDNCGKQFGAACTKVPLVAALSQSQDGTVSVQNVSESCPYHWPWQVSIQRDDHHHCSGTLIHQRFVMTAQHCNVRTEDTVVLGIHDVRIGFFLSQRIPIAKVINLPQDGNFPPGSDLSLLRLSIPARLGRNVAPICVPDQNDDDDLDLSWTCIVTGWGATKSKGGPGRHRLHHTAVILVNESVCRERWGEDLIRDSHICAHPAASTSCLGDSGAPLFCRKHGAFSLFGMVTWGSSSCKDGLPAVFTRVSQFYSWISKETGLSN